MLTMTSNRAPFDWLREAPNRSDLCGRCSEMRTEQEVHPAFKRAFVVTCVATALLQVTAIIDISEIGKMDKNGKLMEIDGKHTIEFVLNIEHFLRSAEKLPAPLGASHKKAKKTDRYFFSIRSFARNSPVVVVRVKQLRVAQGFDKNLDNDEPGRSRVTGA